MDKNTLIFVAICVLAFMFGSHMAMFCFGGIVTLVGFYALCEFIPFLKWIIYHWGRLVDVIFFGFTFYATMNYGVTISMSLMFASIGYTLVYVPYVRKTWPLRHYNKNNNN